jgi:NAD(P)-dependent dehydrogenase (short-subunit alcohol dehydrogenase family)
MLTYSDKTTLDVDRYRQVVEINLYGSVYVAKYASIIMAKNKAYNDRGEKGVILFVSSVAAEEGQRGQVAYSATKGALNGMVLPMARDLGRYNIRVVAIAPGIFETPLSHLMSDKVKKTLNANTPMGRMGKSDEFAHFCQAIIENSYINGVHLRIDGATKFSHM